MTKHWDKLAITTTILLLQIRHHYLSAKLAPIHIKFGSVTLHVIIQFIS